MPTAASKLLVPPRHPALTAAQYRQLYNPGTAGAGNSATVVKGDGSGVNTVLTGANGQQARIVLTPVVDCFWEVDAQSIWRTDNAVWMGVRTAIIMERADADGKTSGFQAADAQHNNALPGWRAAPLNDIFRLQAGLAYAARIQVVVVAQPVKAGMYWWTGWPHLRIEGHTFGHGIAGGLKHLAPPTYLGLPESQLRQIKYGGSGLTRTQSAYTTLLDTAGAPMQLTLTPSVNCFWRLKCKSLWRFGPAAWSSSRVQIDLTPADLDGLTGIGGLDVNLHNDMADWTSLDFGGCFRLQAGTIYTAMLRAAPSAAQNYHARDDTQRLAGFTFGHGSF